MEHDIMYADVTLTLSVHLQAFLSKTTGLKATVRESRLAN